MATKFEDLDKNLNRLVKELEKFDLVLPVMKDAEGVLKQRIFNEGEAASGSKLGKYKSEQWKKKRQASGMQTGYKDLEFSGGLRQDIIVGNVKKSKGLETGQLGFAGGTTRQGTPYLVVAEGQEQQTGKEIFILSETEEKGVMERAEKYLFNRIDKAVNKIFK